MTWWATGNSDKLRIRLFSVLTWTAGASLAAAMLVPVVFEWQSKYTDAAAIKTGLMRAAVILCVTSILGPRSSLEFDFRSRIVRWRRRWFLSSHTRQLNYDAIVLVDCLKRPSLPFARRNILRIQAKNGLIEASLGWSFGAESQRRVDRLVDEIRRSLQLPESSVAPGAPGLPSINPRRQISLRRLMLATLAGAMVLSVARLITRSTPDLALPGGLAAAMMAAASVLWFRWGEPAIERMLMLLLIVYVPLAWIVEVAWPLGRTSGMWGAFLFIPNSFIAAHLFYRANNAATCWIAAAFTLFEFGLMGWCAVRGWKWTLPAAVILGLISCFSSLVFYSGYRM
jgi:hypothetical protein